MTATRIFGEGPTLVEALRSAAQELGVSDLNALKWEFEREHFRGGAWSVRVSAEQLPAEELAAIQADEGKTSEGHKWLREMLRWFHNDGAVISNRRRGDQLILSIEGARDGKLIIGRDGKNLPAFQHLLDKAMARALGGRDTRVLLDVDGYLGEREGRLAQEAREAINEVEMTGNPVRMRDMNSYERRQVHQLVKEHGGMVSRSTGRPRGGFKSIEIALEKPAAE
jgi:predicted RNA-binding protein Jag